MFVTLIFQLILLFSEAFRNSGETYAIWGQLGSAYRWNTFTKTTIHCLATVSMMLNCKSFYALFLSELSYPLGDDETGNIVREEICLGKEAIAIGQTFVTNVVEMGMTKM